MHKIVILGSGESGTGAAILAKRVGYDVFVSDKSPIKVQYKTVLEAQGIPFEEGDHNMERILAADEIVKSPGIPEKTDIMQAIRTKGIPVIGEIELGYRFTKNAKIVAITGSNGKTTTTQLIYHLFKSAGYNAYMGGNVGDSYAELVAGALDLPETKENKRIYVLEVSSFQLDDIKTFKPDVSVLLNITPDHLDRYEYEMSNYVRSKFRITMNQTEIDLFITNADDPEIQRYIKQHEGELRPMMEDIKKEDIKNGIVHLDDDVYDIRSTVLKGPHNIFNAACAINTAWALGMDQHEIQDGLLTFVTPPHRLEVVATKAGITWINDSKATNVDSVFYALQAVDTPIIWIAGGTDKGNDYSPLFDLVRERVKALVCLGLDNEKLKTVFGTYGFPIVEAKSAIEAVEQAQKLANTGETVLLSPACASFDLFKNYEDRGDQFKAAVVGI
jgi:UDP-N-acetylmuramoylalanine--D-glutamate ligase